MADYWMKLYIEILDDPKMATLPDRVWRRIIELFLVAKRQNKDGHLPETRQIAWLLRMPSDELESDLAQISQTGIIVREVGGWFIPKFRSRQDAATVAERVRDHREREKQQEYYDDVTNMKRNVTQRTETEYREQNTETETETETESSSPFDLIRRIIERETGIMGDGPNAVQAINEIIKNDCNEDDVIAGITWLKGQGPIRYYKSVVGPAKVAKQKRIQGGNGNGRSNLTAYTDANGNVVYR